MQDKIFDAINLTGRVPAYLQLENLVMFATASGVLKPGDQLPSMRGMVDTSGLSLMTVAKAYRDLEIMGVVETRRGAGTLLAEDAHEVCAARIRQYVLKKLHDVVGEAKAAGMSKEAILKLTKSCYASETMPYHPTPEAILEQAT